MAAKNKGKKKAVKKAAGRKPVAQRSPRKKREPVPQHGLPPDPPVSHSDREAVANVLLDRGEGGTRPVEPVMGTVAVEVPVEVPVGGTVGLDSGEGATEIEGPEEGVGSSLAFAHVEEDDDDEEEEYKPSYTGIGDDFDEDEE